MKTFILFIFFSTLVFGCSSPQTYDILIKNGQIIDGSGQASFHGDIGINADTVTAIGKLKDAKGELEIDAEGLVVAPGFINVLSWAVETLIEDGRSQSDIRQGVTLEVFGEGDSWGPWNDRMKKGQKAQQGDIQYDITWTTLGEYLEFLERKGVAPNIASFLGTSTIRNYVIGLENREPTDRELDSMKLLVRQAMEEGALGIGSALIYVPGTFAKTDELIALCKEVSKYDGIYISHLRDEGENLIESLEELITISKEANVAAEVYHLKQAGKANWSKLDTVINKIEQARSSGLNITANMYTYTASGTGLDASMPPWVRDGGYEECKKRLGNPELREKIMYEILHPTDEWESLLHRVGSAEKVLLFGFKNDSLKYLTGKTLAEIANMRNMSPEETAMDLIIEDGSRVGTIYFQMSEENVRKEITLPWMSFGSDAESLAPEGVFLLSNPHPRAYGNFSRILGKYVRDEKLISLEEAIYKLTMLPATNLRITKRGAIKKGYYADLVIFDYNTIQDKATFEYPHQYATGMIHVFVNGVQVLKDGEHTGALPGQVVRGPGWKGN